MEQNMPASRPAANDMTISLPARVQKHKIAVVGGAGQIGAAVVQQALNEGHLAVALDRGPSGKVAPQDGYEYRQLDATDFVAYKDAIKDCTAVVHLSAVYNQHDTDGNITTTNVLQSTIHNDNVAMSFNALSACSDLGINRVVLASSVNAVGMLYTKHPKWDYLPLDERHPCRPEDAYSLCKLICEVQSDAIARANPSMRIATLRYHWVVPMHLVDRQTLDDHKGAWKDLWGWVSQEAAACATINAITVPESQFPCGHETFFIASKTICQQTNSMALLKTKYPEEIEIRAKILGNASFYDTTKAERLLGWKEERFSM